MTKRHLLIIHLAASFPACAPIVITAAFVSAGKLLCVFPLAVHTYDACPIFSSLHLPPEGRGEEVSQRITHS